VTRYFNSPNGLVVVSIGVRVLRITNKCALNGSSFKFTELPFVFLTRHLHPKTRMYMTLGLLPVRSSYGVLLCRGVKEEPVGVVDSCRDGFSPKIMG
jgi:hypothetical protein